MRTGRAFATAALVACFVFACSGEEPSEFEEAPRAGAGGAAAGAGGSNTGGDTGGASGNAGSATGGAGAATGGSAGASGATGGTSGGGGVGGTGGGMTGGSATGGSATGGSAGGANCNALENTADLVTTVVIEDDQAMPPMPEEGTLVDGVYELTAVDIYDITGTSEIASRRRTVELRYGGTIWDSVTEQDGTVERIQAFFEVVGTELLVTTLCATGGMLSPRYGYTASADRILTFYTDNLGRVTVNTFTARR